jgi:hypothetical protein
MCTLIILRRPESPWPILIAANRDEMLDRPWSAPAQHWPDRPGVVAGLDVLAGGSWLGVNGTGVVAAMLNRVGTLGPAPGMRSRGELVLEALEHHDAAEAVKAIGAVNGAAYRAFNMVIADNRDAYWVRSLGGTGASGPKVEPIPVGLSVLTANDLNDPSSARTRFYRPRFAAASIPDPGRGNWKAWETLMGSREMEPDAGPHGALNIVTAEEDGKRTGYGTSSSSLIALAAAGTAKPPGVLWRFAAGAPDQAPFAEVTL